MSWEDLQKEKERRENAKPFVRLKDGQSVQGVFAGEPVQFYHKFSDKAFYRDYVKGAGYRFRINFVTKDQDGKMVAKVFEGGRRIADAIMELKNEIGLEKVFLIKRQGSEMNNTSYSLIPKSDLTAEQKTALAAVTLVDLNPEYGEQPADEHSTDVVPDAVQGLEELKEAESIPF